MRSAVSFVAAILLLLTLADAPGRAASQPPARPLDVTVDARDIARRLAHTKVVVPIERQDKPRPVALRYVEWTPGNHNPSGPIQNVVDFVVRGPDGARLDWRRDETSVFRHVVTAPANADRLVVTFSYITNQPAVNSRSSDTYGFEEFGGLNWNTVVVYPEGVARDALPTEARLLLPEGWKGASALTVKGHTDGAIEYHRVPFATLVDSPVIFGRHLRTWEIASGADAAGEPVPHFLHAVAPRAENLELPEKRLAKLKSMVEQLGRVFGPWPYDQFHFLIMLGDDLPGLGLEHATSTYISMKQDRFTKSEGEDGDPMTVVPHELAHVWCGKYAAPVRLHSPDYHTPAETSLLWAYEGLASYVDEIVAARSALMTRDEYEHSLVNAIVSYQIQAGRRWRSIEDTALAMRFLRAPSDAWPDLRRSQDYYVEGGLFWMTADAIIRAGTAGDPTPKSLDDFCRGFMGVAKGDTKSPGMPTREYTRDDVVEALRHIYDGQDWDSLIRAMIERPREGDGAIFDLPARLGYRLEWTDEPTAQQKKSEKKEEGASLRWSIGLAADKEGKVTRLTPGYPADRAGLMLNDRIVGVREAAGAADAEPDAEIGHTLAFTPARLRDAVRASDKTNRVELLIRRAERFETLSIDFGGGLKYPRLVRDESRPDLLSAILTPR